MSYIDAKSCNCTLSQLDLFSVLPTQTSIESSSYGEFCPLASLADNNAPLDFTINGSGQDYVDLGNTQIYVRVQITKGDGTLIDANSHVSPINLLLHSMFSEVELKLNDVIVSSCNGTYPYRAMLETLLSYGSAAKQSQLTCALYYKDTAGGHDESDPHDANLTNSALKARYDHIAAGRTCDLIGPLHLDMMHQNRYLPNDVTIKIKLTRSKDAFVLMSDAQNPTFKLKIVDCKLYVRKIRISPSVFLAHANALQVSNMKFPLRRVICKSYTIASGSRDHINEHIFSGHLPSRLILCCVDNIAYNGSFKHSPFNFKHMNISSIKVYMDGQSQQIKPIETNFTDGDYVHGYLSLYTANLKYRQDEDLDISRSDYPKGYTIFCFDLSPDMNDGANFDLARDGSLRVELKFSQNLTSSINVIVLAEFEELLEISREKGIIYAHGN